MADIRKVLLDEGLITVSPEENYTWFERRLPDTPDEVVVFYDYEGPPADRTHDIRTAIVNPRFQIVCRGESSAVAERRAKAKAVSIYETLDAIVDEVMESGLRYLSIVGLSYPGFFKRDEHLRASFAANFEARIAVGSNS